MFDRLKKIIIILFVFIFAYILGLNIYMIINKTIISLLITCLLIISFYYINKKINIEKFKRFELFTLIIGFILFLIFGYFGKVGLRWDYGIVIKSSFNYITNTSKEIEYFGRYPNNLSLYLITNIICKIISLIYPKFNIDILHGTTIIFNVIILSISFYLLVLLTRKIMSKKDSFLIFLMMILFIPLFMYTSIFYTDTIGLFLNMLSFYIFYLFEEEKNIKNKKIYIIIFSFLIVLGFKLKATNSFLFIAIIMYYLLNKEYKKVFYSFIPLIIFYIVFSLVIKISYPISNSEYDKYKFPYLSWIAMSLDQRYSGGYSKEFVENLIKTGNYNDKVNYSKKYINDWTSKNGINGLLKKVFIGKQLRTWTNPTLHSAYYLGKSPVDKSFIQKTFIKKGEYFKYYYSFISGCWLFILIGSFISGFSSYIKNNKYILISQICLIGIFIFLTFWECNSRYIYSFLPFIFISSIYGYKNLFNALNNRKK